MLSNLNQAEELLLTARFKGEVHDAREFVQPDQYHVQKLLSDLDAVGITAPMDLWDWVCRNIVYPLNMDGKHSDYHSMYSYKFRNFFVAGAGEVVLPLILQVTYDEYFNFPYETLITSVGDCEDVAILLCSILRALSVPSYVALGSLKSDKAKLTHSWVVTEHDSSWQVWEGVANEAGISYPEDNEFYKPLCYFNESEIFTDPELDAVLISMKLEPISDVLQSFGMIKDKVREKQIVHQLIKERA